MQTYSTKGLFGLNLLLLKLKIENWKLKVLWQNNF